MASNLSLAVKLTLNSSEFRSALQSSNEQTRKFAADIRQALSGADASMAKLTASGVKQMLATQQAQKATQQWAALSAQGLANANKGWPELTAATRTASLSFRNLSESAGAALKSLVGVSAFAGLQQLARDAFQAQLAFDSQQKALINVTGSVQQAAREYAFLNEVADKYGVTLADVSKTYVGFTAATKASSLAGDDARNIFEGIVATLTRYGATSDQISGVILQVTQGLNKQKIQLEDLNVIGERGIPIIDLLAKAYGKQASEITDLIGKGLLPADEAYRKVFATVGSGTDRVTSLAAGLNRLSTEWDKVLRAFANAAPLQLVIDKMAALLKAANDIRAISVARRIDTAGATTDQLDAKEKVLLEKLDAAERSRTGFGGLGLVSNRVDIAGQLREELLQIQLEREAIAVKVRAAQPAEEAALAEKITAEQLRGTTSKPSEPVKYDKQRAAVMADYLESRGLKPLAVAAVIGNLAQEAPGGQGNFGTALSGDQGSIGLAQWRLERKDEFLKFASAQGVPATDLKVQLDFLVAEAKRRGDLDALNAARTPEQATEIFMRRFERPAESSANLDYRQAVASDVYAQSSLDRLRLASKAKTETGTDTRMDDEKRLYDALTAMEEHRSDVIAREREKQRQLGIATYEQITDDLARAVEEENRLSESRHSYERQINAQAEADFQRKQEAQKEFLQTAYDEKLVSAREYYSGLQKLADTELQHTQKRIDAEIELEKVRLSEINKSIEVLTERSQSTIELQTQQIESLSKIESLTAQKTIADEQFRSTSREITVGATAAQTEATPDKNPVTDLADQFNAKLGDMSSFAFSTAQGMQNAFAEFFESGMQGTESLGQAFAKMARRIAAEIAAMMATKAIISFIGLLGQGVGGLFSASSAATSGVESWSSEGVKQITLATGGPISKITGPGTGTSDSIDAIAPVGSYIIREQAMRGMGLASGGMVPVRVSNGEGYVSPSVVRSVGVATLDRINSLGAGLRMYADGGMVAGSTSIVGGDTINVNMPLTVNGAIGGQDGIDTSAKAQALKRELRDAVDGRIVELQRPGGLLWGSRG